MPRSCGTAGRGTLSTGKPVWLTVDPGIMHVLPLARQAAASPAVLWTFAHRGQHTPFVVRSNPSCICSSTLSRTLIDGTREQAVLCAAAGRTSRGCWRACSRCTTSCARGGAPPAAWRRPPRPASPAPWPWACSPAPAPPTCGSSPPPRCRRGLPKPPCPLAVVCTQLPCGQLCDAQHSWKAEGCVACASLESHHRACAPGSACSTPSTQD